MIILTMEIKSWLKNNVPSCLCIVKFYNSFIENAAHVDDVVLMEKILEYWYNYFMTSRIIWNYRHEVNNHAEENKNSKQRLQNEQQQNKKK